VGFTGRTLGKWATGLRVQRTNGAEPGVGRAFLRHFVGYPLSFLTLGFGFLLAALSTRGRALHDFIADTIVVREG
ncbi:MAG TPA: RDD family protein, partial [Pyrinomonadaceae bacterium]|nr:RDD family protein [Pyrinomonadaceae bacterium]